MSLFGHLVVNEDIEDDAQLVGDLVHEEVADWVDEHEEEGDGDETPREEPHLCDVSVLVALHQQTYPLQNFSQEESAHC